MQPINRRVLYTIFSALCMQYCKFQRTGYKGDSFV